MTGLLGSNVVRILIVEDHPLVRDGLISRVGSQTDMTICGEADNIEDALHLIKTTNPDLVIVDISLKGGNGLDLIKQIKAGSGTRPRVLVSSMYEDNLYAERAIRAGALGYINKQESPDKLLEAIRHVHTGKIYLSPETSQRLLRRTVRGEPIVSESPISELSDRELEVFTMIGRGQTTRQIAGDLKLSIKTVETHRENIKTKLGIENAAELARSAVQWVLENS